MTTVTPKGAQQLAPTKKRTVNARAARFVREYLKDLNATQAAIRAGYAPGSASLRGPKLLANPAVMAAVRKAEAKTAERLQVTRDQWLEELKIVAFSSLEHYLNIAADGTITTKGFSNMPGGSSRALESITETVIVNRSGTMRRVTFKLHSKLEALKIMGKHFGFLADKPEPVDEQDGFQMALRLLFDKSGVPSLPEFMSRMHLLTAGGNNGNGAGPGGAGEVIDVQPIA